MNEPRDAPYPELKKTHTMAHVGRPFTDFKPPAAAPVWAVIEGLGRYHVLLAALELGLFEALNDAEAASGTGIATGASVADSGLTAGELAARLNLPELHLEALLDSVVALGLLDRVVERFRLNDAARRYLLVDSAASMAALIPVAPGPHENWTRLAATVRSGRPATPIDDDPAAFYVPLVEGTFTTMWRCATRADLKMRYSALGSPRILDLGAGGAPWSIAMLQACATGRATINDLDGVIEVARRKTAEHGVADRCEFRSGDFHTIDVEDGAYDIVVLGHICRTEGPEGAARLVERAYAALRPEGRIVLADYFVGPNHKTNPHAVLMGMTMMASTVNGFTVTTEAATAWLHNAGFEAVRLIEPIGFQFAYVASKPRN